MDEKSLQRFLWLGGLFPLGDLLLFFGMLDTSIVEIVQSVFLIFPIIANVVFLIAGIVLKQRGIKGWAIAGFGVSLFPMILAIAMYAQLTSRGGMTLLAPMILGMILIIVDSVTIGFLARRIGNTKLLIVAVIIALLGLMQVGTILVWFNIVASILYIVVLSPKKLSAEWSPRAVPRKAKVVLGIVTLTGLVVLASVPYLVVGTIADLAHPHFITANFTELSKISNISRFRSHSGHAFTDAYEGGQRSMKHYFTPEPAYKNSSSAIEIYAPADVIFEDVGWEGHEMTPGKIRGFHVDLVPIAAPEYQITIFHVNMTAGLVPGMYLKSGQVIGHADTRFASNFDIAIGLQLPFGEYRRVSYFGVMADAVFGQFQARGVATRDQMIITRADADAAEGMNMPMAWSVFDLT